MRKREAAEGYDAGIHKLLKGSDSSGRISEARLIHRARDYVYAADAPVENGSPLHPRHVAGFTHRPGARMGVRPLDVFSLQKYTCACTTF